MVKRHKGVDALQPRRETVSPGETQQRVGRPGGGTQAWSIVHQLPDGGKRMGARRNIPFGPLGGSGRKTNLSRSS